MASPRLPQHRLLCHSNVALGALRVRCDHSTTQCARTHFSGCQEPWGLHDAVDQFPSPFGSIIVMCYIAHCSSQDAQRQYRACQHSVPSMFQIAASYKNTPGFVLLLLFLFLGLVSQDLCEDVQSLLFTTGNRLVAGRCCNVGWGGGLKPQKKVCVPKIGLHFAVSLLNFTFCLGKFF